jgi:hypothetical protein
MHCPDMSLGGRLQLQFDRAVHLLRHVQLRVPSVPHLRSLRNDPTPHPFDLALSSMELRHMLLYDLVFYSLPQPVHQFRCLARIGDQLCAYLV